MALVTRIGQPFLDERNDRLGARRPIRRPVFHGHFMSLPLDPHDRAVVQETRDRQGIERGRHDDQDQVGAHLPPDLAQQRQRQVAIQVALVKFVEDDGADRFEERVGQELPGQDALGQEPQAGLG